MRTVMLADVTPWLTRAALVGGGVVVGGLAGRYLTEPRVEVRTETRDVVRDVVREVVKVEVREVAAQAVTKVIYRDRVTSPTGECHETSVERTESVATASRGMDVNTQAERTHEAAHEAVTVTTPAPLPPWRLSLLVGASIREPLLPLYGPLVLGVAFEGRVFGPLSAGVWLQTFGAAGASLSLSF